MDAALVSQLAHLDRALLALIEERARLLAAIAASSGGRIPATSVEDLLRRHGGALGAADVRRLLEEIDDACRRSLPGASGESR